MVCSKIRRFHSEIFKSFGLFSLIFSLIFCFSCSADFGTLSRVTEETLADGTLVMVYMAGANSLSSEIITDLNNMELGLYNSSPTTKRNLHVVALADQMDSNIDDEYALQCAWNGTRLYEVQSDSSSATYLLSSGKLVSANIGSTLVKTASYTLNGQTVEWRTSSDQEEDMGDISTLAHFIYWARETHPYCSKQILILWDHGAGYSSEYSYSASSESSRNVCSDDETVVEKNLEDESFGTTLYIDEIHELLETIYSEDNKLEMIGFDACYMGQYEVAYEFKDVAKYMAASPVTEYGGWTYDYIFAQDDSVLSGKNFAMNVVTGYEIDNYTGNCMTAFDLSYMTELKEKIDNLASDVGLRILSLGSTSTIITEVNNNTTVKFLSLSHSTQYDKYYPYYELGSYLDYFSSNDSYGDQGFGDDVKSDVEEVQAILKKIVLRTWLSTHYGSQYDDGISYGMGIFGGTKNYSGSSKKYTVYNFYTDSIYTQDSSVLGYGGIDAATLGSTGGTVETWRELQNLIYTGSGY